MDKEKNKRRGHQATEAKRECPTAHSARLIWAEKTVLALTLASAGLTAILWATTYALAGQAGASHVFASIGKGFFEQGFLCILALWISFRAMDLLAGGSTYRLLYRMLARPAAPRLPHFQLKALIRLAGHHHLIKEAGRFAAMH